LDAHAVRFDIYLLGSWLYILVGTWWFSYCFFLWLALYFFRSLSYMLLLIFRCLWWQT